MTTDTSPDNTSTPATSSSNAPSAETSIPAAPAASAGGAPPTSSSSSALSLPSNRFELELEFVQSLASPAYLHYLATSGILNQPAFLDFLRYLRYWKQPQYAKYLSYPHCLYFLDLLVPPSSDPTLTSSTASTNESKDTTTLSKDDEKDGSGATPTTTASNTPTSTTTPTTTTDQGEAFRREMAQVQFRNFVHEQQFYSWQFRSARLYGKGVAADEEDGGGEVNAGANEGEAVAESS